MRTASYAFRLRQSSSIFLLSLLGLLFLGCQAETSSEEDTHVPEVSTDDTLEVSPDTSADTSTDSQSETSPDTPDVPDTASDTEVDQPEVCECEASEVCEGGQCLCGEVVCAEDQQCCSDQCVDIGHPSCPCGNKPSCGEEEWCCEHEGAASCVLLGSDSYHCGACGVMCTGDLGCISGECGCRPDRGQCGVSCYDTDNDLLHCGGCGELCTSPSGEASCLAGSCELDCSQETLLGNCDLDTSNGCETDLRQNEYCGDCENPCPVGATCHIGGTTPFCVCDDTPCPQEGEHHNQAGCFEGACMLVCNSNQKNCDGDPTNSCETEISEDAENCGGCGATCAPDETCSEGVCLCGGEHCGEDKRCCEADGALSCVSNDSLLHCGGCGIECGPGERCEEGRCVCGNQSSEGMEACHAAAETCCGDECVPPSDPSCACGSAPSCASDERCCDAVFGPTCTPVMDNVENCGACGALCEGDLVCSAGDCVCPDTHPTSCDDACVDTLTDLNHCGSCGEVCAGENPACCNGACVDLDNDSQACGACETICSVDETCCEGACISLQDNPAHCGACGHDCGAGEVCCAGVCEGIEENLAHCGGCGVHCLNPPYIHVEDAQCVTGSCEVLACEPDWGNCHAASLGCETHLLSEASNCGVCGNDCKSHQNINTGACDEGSCTYTCQAGFEDCNKTGNDGCEISLNDDPENCGACANDCNKDPNIKSATCYQGKCKYTCNRGFMDCTSDPGCETENGPEHCGECNRSCDPPGLCSPDGMCVSS